MKTLAIDDQTGDLVMSQGSLVVLGEPDACVQRVRSRLRMILGEWFLDTSKGLDWDILFVKNPNLASIQANVREQLEDLDSVSAVTSVQVVVDDTTRTATITVAASTDFGTTINVSESI